MDFHQSMCCDTTEPIYKDIVKDRDLIGFRVQSKKLQLLLWLKTTNKAKNKKCPSNK